mmetsp:Transcript_23420/g.61531  ORF Transcript_23420/g.61531 Transcript_23420/m.61531 type:complete len:535 (-) Transcript_23420:61-1665(-)
MIEREEAEALLQLAKEKGDQEPERALQAAKQAGKICKSLGDASGALEAFRLIVFSKAATGDADSALGIARAEVAHFKEAGERRGQAHTLLTIAEANVYLGHGFEALAPALQAQRLYFDLGDVQCEAQATRVEAHAHLLRSDPGTATKRATDARIMFESCGDKAGEASSWHLLSSTRLAEDCGPEAYHAAKKATTLYHELGNDRGECTMLNNTAQMDLALQKNSNALRKANEALRIAKDLGDLNLQTTVLETVVNSHIAVGEGPEALHVALELQSMFTVLNWKLQARFLGTLVSAHLANQDLDAALTAARKARAVSCKGGLEEAKTIHRMAQVLVMREEFDAALETAEEALVLARQSRSLEVSILSTITQIYTCKGEVEKAPHRKVALRVLDLAVQATKDRDPTAFEEAMLNVDRIGGVTAEDVKIKFATILDDPGVRHFMGQRATQDTQMSVSSKYFHREGIYLWFRSNAMGYGPRFRPIQETYRCRQVGDPNVQVLTVLRLHDGAEDWEEQMPFAHPGVADAALQAQGVLNAQ